MHFQPSELEVMFESDVNFWINQLSIELKEQNKITQGLLGSR